MQPLTIDIKPSKTLLTLLRISHIGAVLIIAYLGFYSHLHMLWCALLFVGCYYSYYHNLAQHVLFTSPNAIITLQKDTHDQWSIITRAGEFFPVSIENETFLSRSAVIFRLKITQKRPRKWTEKHKRYLAIAQDSLKSEHFRQLILSLKNL